MSRSILLAAALMVLAAPAVAQQSPPGQPGQPAPQSRPMPFFLAMDADNDGAVSQAEFLAAHQQGGKGYSAADQNKDGVVSRDEFVQAGQQRREARFKQLDRDGDGRLTQEELQQNVTAMFNSMDANGDGRITQDEAMHRRARGMGPGMMQQGQMPPEGMPMGPGGGQR